MTRKCGGCFKKETPNNKLGSLQGVTGDGKKLNKILLCCKCFSRVLDTMNHIRTTATLMKVWDNHGD